MEKDAKYWFNHFKEIHYGQFFSDYHNFPDIVGIIHINSCVFIFGINRLYTSDLVNDNKCGGAYYYDTFIDQLPEEMKKEYDICLEKYKIQQTIQLVGDKVNGKVSKI